MSNNSSSASSGGIGFCGLLAIVFIVLKLLKVISWSWLWVLSPLWIPFVIAVAILIPYFIVVIIIGMCVKNHKKKRRLTNGRL